MSGGWPLTQAAPIQWRKGREGCNRVKSGERLILAVTSLIWALKAEAAVAKHMALVSRICLYLVCGLVSYFESVDFICDFSSSLATSLLIGIQ